MATYALILAAGFSTRMAPEFKPLLSLPYPQGPRTVLAALCKLYTALDVRPLVVGGHRADDVAAAARAQGVDFTVNPTPEDGMFSSLCAGLAALPAHCEHFFVQPVDVPLVRAMTLHSLLDAARAGQADIYIPTFCGKNGHPPLVCATLIPTLRQWQGPDGLRGFFARQRCTGVPVADALMLRDMDTPEQAAQLRELAPRQLTLDVPEAEELLNVRGLAERGQAHCRAVAAVAAAFSAALNRARAARGDAPLLDVVEARVGGLTHDMCKGQPQHEAAAGVVFRGWGMERMAWLIESHRDLSLPDDAPVTEREVVFLADKYVHGASPVPLDQRFQQKLDRFADDPDAVAAITGRRDRARALAARMGRECGHDMEELVRQTLPDPAPIRESAGTPAAPAPQGA